MERRIFLPWEHRGGLTRGLGLGRIRPFLIAAVVIGLLVVIGLREREAAGVRQTRANLITVRSAVDRYLADHEGGCPPTLGALEERGYVKTLPRDAWGRSFRLVCPAGDDTTPYELMSDGPDGLPGGLDRIE